MTTATQKGEYSTNLKLLGWEIVCSEPVGVVQDGRASISYATTLTFKGKEVWTGPFYLGIGNVDWKKPLAFAYSWGFTEEQQRMLEAKRRHPNANFKNKELEASTAAKAAKKQKVEPTIADVIYCLLLDGEAYLGGFSFEDWCSEFGYDADSIKTKKLFDACDETGRKMYKVGKEVLEKTHQILEGY